YTTGNFQDTADFDPGPGTYNLTSNGSSDIFVSKLNASGNFLWARAVGGVGIDYSYKIYVDANGNVYVAGTFNGNVDFDPGPGVYNFALSGNSDAFILKLDSSGNFVWARHMGGASGDAAKSMTIDAGGNIYLTGTFQGTADFDPGPGTYNMTSNGNDDV